MSKNDEPLHEYLARRRPEVHPRWSQGDLARRAQVSATTISRLESGKTKQPPIDLLARVAPLYEVPVLDLWVRGGYLRSTDAEAFAELLAQVAPAEMLRLAFLHGPWPQEVCRVVSMALNASLGLPPP